MALFRAHQFRQSEREVLLACAVGPPPKGKLIDRNGSSTEQAEERLSDAATS